MGPIHPGVSSPTVPLCLAWLVAAWGCAPAEPVARTGAQAQEAAPDADAILARCAAEAGSGIADTPSITPWQDKTGRLRAEESQLLPAAVAAGDAADPELLARLGRVYSDAGETERALAVLTRALSRQPGDAASWVALGDALVVRGELRVALVLFARAKELDRDLTAAFARSGEVLERLGDASGAREEYRAALDRDPRRLDARLGLAGLCEQEGRLADARAELEKALEVDADSPTALFRLARIARAQGDGAAAADFERRHERAAILEDLRLREASVSRATKLLALGARFLGDGRLEEAEREYAAAREAARDDAERQAAVEGLLRCARAGRGDAAALARELSLLGPEGARQR